MSTKRLEENPWKTLSSKIVYRNPWITVREDQVIRPDGLPGIYGVVDSKIATGVVALTPDYKVYLVGQYRYPMGSYSWEIIEGGADSGETPLEAIKRELQEEAGLQAEKWEQLGDEFHLSNCFSSERAVCFIAQELSETKSSPEGTEVLQVICIPFVEAIRRVGSGEIKDSVSIIALLRAERLLLSRGVI